ncbi:unnamed protein product [Didymodactylos carnosus]|uniref:Uncharacterized protein n=1 Tax=Didymodactylos carnosus TaxID=1234261 RepID=A0A8S2FF86_9BILA|nr:unnamed protein product [Didymodactylos carnosus]CAF4246066.1 unnamed protein product [Didymodactylos carnosus]
MNSRTVGYMNDRCQMEVSVEDHDVFKALHDCMKDMSKFRQYLYYIGTSCDTRKLRNKIQKLKERIIKSFTHQRELIFKTGKGANSKSDLASIVHIAYCSRIHMYMTIDSLVALMY